jgi:hypothetical protein
VPYRADMPSDTPPFHPVDTHSRPTKAIRARLALRSCPTWSTPPTPPIATPASTKTSACIPSNCHLRLDPMCFRWPDSDARPVPGTLPGVTARLQGSAGADLSDVGRVPRAPRTQIATAADCAASTCEATAQTPLSADRGFDEADSPSALAKHPLAVRHGRRLLRTQFV